MAMRIPLLLVVFLACLLGDKAQGYSNFIGYGYTSCINCHYNAFGAGPINDYGRALWASEIAGRVFSKKSATEEDLANASGLLGTTKIPFWWRPALAYRGLYLTQSAGNNQQSRTIHMQADFMNVIRLDKKDNYLFVGTIGYVPRPRLASASDPASQSTLISREHYFRWTLSKAIRFQIGMQDKVYGLRVPDHIAFSRAETRNAQNDQAHGLAMHFNSGKWEGGLEVFAGNLFQEAPLREKGASLLLEYEIAEKTRLGTSLLSSRNDFFQQHMGALHGRFGIGKGSSFIIELGTINRRPVTGTATWPLYGFFQTLFRLGDGFHFLNTFEYFTQDISKLSVRQLRFTPGIMYFPGQRFEIRIEAMNSRSYDPGGARGDRWDILSQLHLYF
jgi:hypothetical protein